MEDKKKVGRPKENFIPWDNWYNDILDLYMEGGSDVEVRALMIQKMGRESFSFDLWDRWLKEEQEFSETVKMGRTLSEAWWVKQGRKYLTANSMPETIKMNYTGWYMNMKNRFKWSDKQEIEQTESRSITLNLTKK